MAIEASTTWSPGNNSATVKALLLSRLSAGQQPDRAVHPYYQPWSQSVVALPPTVSNSSPTSSEAKVPPPACPMHDAATGTTTTSSSASASASTSKLNPLNMLPNLTQDRAKNQQTQLSTERVRSTIPRTKEAPAPGASPYDKATPTASTSTSASSSSSSSSSGCPVPHDQRAGIAGSGSSKDTSQDDNWEYPSPQQFYNALVRKGWETPEEHVEMMVMVHNFLNERAWQEVLDWEKEMGIANQDVKLARFQGKPGTISPKARIFSWAAMVAPSRFSSEAPFDRHDWVVERPQGKQIRYVIDYYSAPDDPETDEPVFHLDVRPALDSVEASLARLKRGFRDWQHTSNE